MGSPLKIITIKNGGINDIPKTFNPKTGLSKI